MLQLWALRLSALAHLALGLRVVGFTLCTHLIICEFLKIFLFLPLDNRGFTYYKMSNLDNRISNADQLLTTDIDKFCESVTDVYSNVSKPILDIVLYVYRLTVSLGGQVILICPELCNMNILIVLILCI